MTLTPMMFAKLLHHVPEEKQSWFSCKSSAFFDNIIALYGVAL